MSVKFTSHQDQGAFLGQVEDEKFLKEVELSQKPKDTVVERETTNFLDEARSLLSWEEQYAISEWESGESDTISYVNEDGDRVLIPGTVPGGPSIGKPVFQYKVEPFTPLSEGGLLVTQSENAISFIPGGFRGGKTVNTMNPVREEIGGDSALMSLVHVLTIPRKRIYNAVTLTKNHKSLLREMKALGEVAVKTLMKGSKTDLGSFKWVYSQEGEIVMSDGSKKSASVVQTDLSPSCQQNFHRKILNPTILNSFHVYPAASVGWLHLHSYVGELLTTAHDSMESAYAEKGLRKNTPYDEVIDSLY